MLGQEQSQSLNASNNFDPVTFNYSSPQIGLETEVTGIRLYIKFYLDDKAYELVDESNDEELTVDVSVNITNQSDIAPFTKTLKISRKEPEQMLVYDLGALIPDGLAHDINISPDFDYSANVFTTNHRASIKLNTKLVTDYHTGTKLTAGGKEILEINNVTPPANPGAMSRLINFSWTADNPYPAFQLQVVKLYNTDPSKKESDEITTQVDWSKALTLELFNDGNATGSKSVAINMIEGTGYYAWRVRPLGNFGEGLTSDPRNLGAWSEHPDNSVLEINQTTSEDYLFYFTDPEEDKNWSYTRVFSEDVDKRKGIIQFANGLNFVQQTQTYLHSSDVMLVTQAVVDYTGRTSINTMPVPIRGEGDLKTYKTDFFRTESNQLYTAKDFDADDNFRDPAKNNASNTFSYYSGTDGLVPDAKNYAFSRVIYYNDGTGRVKEQTGVGEMHHIGTGAGGKTTRFYYTSPTEAELITLFGIEAPSPESVMKITTVDPNGVASVQYKGKDGKLLATAIQEKTTANPVLEELDYPEHTNTLGETSEFKNELNLLSRDGFVTSKRFVLTHHESNLEVTYTPPSDFWTADFGTCIDGNCSYNLRIEIFDLNAPTNEQLYWWHEQPVDNQTQPFTEIVNKIDALGNVIETGIADGEYIVVKTLTPSENNMGELSANNMVVKLQPVIRLIQYWLRSYVSKEPEDGGWSLDHFYQQVIAIPGSIDDRASTEEVKYPEYELFKDLVEGEEKIINWPPDNNFMSALGISNIEITEDENQRPAELIIYTCGEPLVIPLNKELPTYKCVADDEIERTEAFYNLHFNTPYDPDNDQGLLNFEDYMQKKLAGLISGYASITEFYEALFPGYKPYIHNVQPGDFNRMIFHMLTDEYAQVNANVIAGQASTVPGGDPLRIEKRQYTCNELWPKWVNTVRIIEDITETNGEFNVADAFDTESGGSQDDLDDHFNDNFDPPFGGWLFKWIFDIILSNRMREFSGDRLVTVQIKQNLPYMFLHAAGFKFARIKDRWEERTEDYYKVLDEDQNEYDLYTNGGEFSEDLPFIHCPVFAFKYFEYNSRVIIIPFINKKKYLGWEPCERFMNYGLDESPLEGDCVDNEETLKLFADWDFTDRQMFYYCILNKPVFPEEEEGELQDCQYYRDNPLELSQKIRGMNDDCKAVIDRREPEFYNSLKAELIENGYVLGGCEGTENLITQAFLQEMTEGIMTQLKENTCNLSESGWDCEDDFTCDPGYVKIQLDASQPGKVESMYSVMYGDIKLNFKLPTESCPETPEHVLHVQNGEVQPSGN